MDQTAASTPIAREIIRLRTRRALLGAQNDVLPLCSPMGLQDRKVRRDRGPALTARAAAVRSRAPRRAAPL
jgi:hypothetical protein